jgi:RNA polymerase sigma factor (sigma-70 family)
VEASTLQQAVAPRVTRLSIAPRLLRLRSNEQLVSLFRAGEEDAFRVIHDRYRGPLLTYARHVLGASQADAEDVLQDVFVRAYRGLRAHDRRLNLSPWLYRVARNACVDELRRRVPVPHDEMMRLTDRALDEDPVHAESIQRERVSRLLSDLQRLPEQQRSALLLCELVGLSYADVAATLETSVSAVKSLLVRARLGLAQSLEARETACSEIRDELAGAHARGERPNALARRHLHDCQGCRGYSVAMRDRTHALAALTPAMGPVAVLAKLFGFGGAGSGASAGAAAAGGAGGTGAASGGLAVSAGVIGANAAHVLTVLAATTIVAAGAIGIKEAIATHTPVRPSAPALPSYVPPAPQTATASSVGLSRPGAATAAAAIHRDTAVGSGSAATPRSQTATSSAGAASTAISSAPSATTAPSSASTKTSSSSSCAIGQQSCGGATGTPTSYSGTSATNTGATSSKLPLGSGGSSAATGKPHLSVTPIGGTGSSSGPTPSTSTSSSSSQPLGSSSSPPLGS